MSGCVLLVAGEFDPSEMIAGTGLSPYQLWRKGELGLPGNPRVAQEDSGFKLLASGADELREQIEETVTFLELNRGDLGRVLAKAGLEAAYLDFANTCRLHPEDVAVQCDVFPVRLLALCGELGLEIMVSLYPVFESSPD